MQVWKYKLNWGETTLKLTGDAVHFAIQDGVPCLWAESYPEQETRDRYFKIVGTGHEVDGDSWHVGSVLDGPYVWHLYQEAR